MNILSMSGFVPEHICDTLRFTQYNGERNISHYCGYASDFISQVLNDDEIDGAVFPKTCDSTRIMESYLSDSNKFLYQLNIPYGQDENAMIFFAKTLRDYKLAIENYYGISINDIEERCHLINNRNNKLAGLYKELESISYYEYLSGIHKMLKYPLVDQEISVGHEKVEGKRKKVFLIGSFLSNIEIGKMIEDVGLKIIGDNLPESGRLVSSKPVLFNDDIYMEISRNILSQRLSPTQNRFDCIIDEDKIFMKDISGIVFVSQQYCEPYDYLYSLYSRAIEGIPILHITVNDSQDSRKVKLMAEAFADTL